MAYQPKSYKKFVATAATATLVATAIVPVASAADAKSFKDVSKTYQEAVNYLVTNNIAEGKSDTMFGTTATITRGDAAVMIAKALKLDTAKAPSAGFKDVNARVGGAVNALVDAKIVSGKTATTFAPDANITRQEMAKIITNAYKLNAGTTKNKFKDVNSNWDAYVDALVANSITLGKTETTFAPTASVTRGEFALFVFRTENLTPATPSIVSVTATNAKTLTVTFNKAVDTEKAKLEVVKSTIKQNVSKATWAADGKSATLELSTKLTKGEYTVNVTGLSESLSKSVVVADEKVESIEILSDVAVVDNTTAPTVATVAYQVKNQYGEDVTKTTSLTTNSADVAVNPATGVVTISGTTVTSAKVGGKVAVALIHAETAKSATKVVTLSAQAAVTDVAITSLYNKDGKALNESTVLATDAFYLIVDVKDQYGNAITDKTKAAAGLIKSQTNTTVVDTDGLANALTLTDLTIDGKKKLGLKLTGTPLKAGENQVTLISTTSGKNASYKIVVAETTATDAITLSAPALAVAKEDILVPATVLDKEGKAVTDLKVLNSPTKGVKVNFGPASVTTPFVKDKDGNVFIKVPAIQNPAPGVVALVAQSSTFKVATSTIKVEDVAVPKTIRGLKNPLALKTGATKTLTVADVVVEDQYGRAMDSADVVGYLNTNNKGILIKKANASSAVVTLPGAGAAPANDTILHNTGVVVTAGAANGSETLQFVLAKNDGTAEVAASTADATVRVTDGTEYSAYEIAAIGKVQAKGVQSAGDKDFVVNGVLNGGKVKLAQGTDFTATITGGKGTASVAADKITVTAADLNTNTVTAPIDTEFTLKVTINATGQVIEQKFIVSPDDKVVEDFFFTTATVASNYAAATGITEATLANGSKVASADLTVGTAEVTFATTDQYGNKAVIANAPTTVTIVPEKASQVTIVDNGTADAKATLKTPATEAKLTVKVKVGTATKELKVTLK